MGISKYKKSLIVLAIFAIFVVIIFIIINPSRSTQDFSLLLPGVGFVEIVLLFLVFWPLGIIVGGLFAGYILSPLFLFFHKKTIGIKMSYGIQDNRESPKFKSIFKGVFPALMAINFSLMFALNTTIANAVVHDIGDVSEMPSVILIIAFTVILTITNIIAWALFSPVWFLSDAGIVYSNQERVETKQLDNPIIGRSVGGWYMYLLKGYAGIAVIFSYYQLISTYITEFTGGSDLIALIINLILLLPIMFFLSIAAIPAFILLDITKKHRINYVRKWAEKFGISKKVEILFQEKR